VAVRTIENTRPGELAEALALTRGAVSKVIDKLEAENWITGSTSPEDNRVRLFALTRRGSRVLPELAEIADRNDRTLFDILDAGERELLANPGLQLVDLHNIGAVPIQESRRIQTDFTWHRKRGRVFHEVRQSRIWKRLRDGLWRFDPKSGVSPGWPRHCGARA
jgi:DNA-binding MarR family transcriptional regulator